MQLGTCSLSATLVVHLWSPPAAPNYRSLAMNTDCQPCSTWGAGLWEGGLCRPLDRDLCRWLSESQSHCQATNPSEPIAGSYSLPTIIAKTEGEVEILA